jgi:hypothetical protein
LVTDESGREIETLRPALTSQSSVSKSRPWWRFW